jgi:hypothetical protein
MPAPSNSRIKLTFGGSIHSAAPFETAFFMSYSGPSVVDGTAFANWLTAEMSLMNDALTAICGLNDPTTVFTTLRGDIYPASSLAVSQTSTKTLAGYAGTGSYGGPVSQAMCVSHYTATAGRSGRGRMYFPATALLSGAATDSGFTSAQATNIASAWGNALTALNAADGPDGSASVKAVVQSLHTATTHPITQVLVDGRPDRIEHREKFITFPRSSHAV